MPTHLVNLDALIKREDFEVKADEQPPSQLTQTMKVSELTPDSLTYQVLRKPDFQRETANWTPQKVAEFVQSFLEGDLIPSIILWRSPSRNIFVIDGAHRLSALIAWVHDDYGDGELSRDFYNNVVPPEQKDAADKTRTLIKRVVGSYQEVLHAGRFQENSDKLLVARARNLSALAVQLQWVPGDARKAEASFFKINQKATPIDPGELQMIKSRHKPNAIAARALLHAGVGHKYWSEFSAEKQREIEQLAREIYDTLFTPVLESPIKTLDLPVAGRGYSAESVSLAFQFVNLANGLLGEKDADDLQEDSDGETTVSFIKRVKSLSFRISGTNASSLGLHPAVYFYGATGRYQPSAFLSTVLFIQWLEQRNAFKRFTAARDRFEEFLLKYRYFTNQIVSKYGTASSGRQKRSLQPLAEFFTVLLEGVTCGEDDEKIIERLHMQPKLKFLKEMSEEDMQHSKEFSRETKSMVYLREALQNALRCKICNARMHNKSFSYDHIVRKQQGGMGNPENAQITHPYCNTGYKESENSAKAAEPRATNAS